ncbi:hypothetical protein [Paraburkholderia caribensis]|uniref:hypothetical protein n=1 Tax=Paraburkholderia caribensis TaxID=75105 RepID=UPI00078D7AD8|nr:hypothetical protein [Paraburkholderia caribensis]AMV48207.1 hypothetical protein ATN79_46935 [Paraburkholderia caribensis]
MKNNDPTGNLDLIVAEALDELVNYLSDCFGEKWVPNLQDMSLAFDHIYQPVPGFWGEFSCEMISMALDEACPDWSDTLSKLGRNRFDDFLVPVLQMLSWRGFDEGVAEKLLRLPVEQRPTDAGGVAEWINADAAKKLESNPNCLFAQLNLALVRRDTLVRAEGVLEYARRFAAVQ